MTNTKNIEEKMRKSTVILKQIRTDRKKEIGKHMKHLKNIKEGDIETIAAAATITITTLTRLKAARKNNIPKKC